MAHVKFDFFVWRGNTGIFTDDSENPVGFVVRVLDSDGVASVPALARFKTSCGAMEKDSDDGDVLLDQTLNVNGVDQGGYTVVPFSVEETRALNACSYELEYVTGETQITEYYGNIKAKGGTNND